MSKKGKIFTIVTAAVLVAILLAVLLIVFIPEKETHEVEFVRPEDIHIPDKLDDERLFGLFFYNEDGSMTRSTEPIETVNYDPSKPLVIFIHGMLYPFGYHSNELIPNAVGWLEKGYNVAEFCWSQLSDFMPNVGTRKVWGRGAGNFMYEADDGQRTEESEDLLNYSIAECFVAYYLDFMEKNTFKGSEIRLTGLSLGGSTVVASMSYLFALLEDGWIDKEFLPDRMSLFDAYLEFTGGIEAYNVPWLNEPMNEGGPLYYAVEVTKKAHDMGIATEYIASSMVSNLPDIVSPGSSKKLHDNTMFLQFNNAFAGMDQGLQHTSGKTWYFNTVSADPFMDKTDLTGTQYAFGPLTPTPYVYARQGARYSMERNNTENVFTDDVLYSDVTVPKIAGFAFNDANANGINDDRLMNRLASVKAELYCGEEKIGEVVTDESGYYEFILDGSAVGKTYTLKVTPCEGWTYADRSDDEYYGNALDGNGTAQITVSGSIDLKIVNSGLIKG